VIFIDGDHSYDSVAFDINQAKRIIKDNGVICGDDLELQKNDIDHSEPFKNIGDLVDKDSGITYHPGVTYAVEKYFGQNISSENGFWVQIRENDSWNNLTLEIEDSKHSFLTDVIKWGMEENIYFLFEVLVQNQIKKVILYGAGKHTSKLLKVLDKIKAFPAQVSAIIDDNVKSGSVEGIPIIPKNEIDNCCADAIVLSSDSFEDVMVKKSETITDLPIVKLYLDY